MQNYYLKIAMKYKGTSNKGNNVDAQKGTAGN